MLGKSPRCGSLSLSLATARWIAKPAATSSTAEMTPPCRIWRRGLPISSGFMSKRSFGMSGSSDSTFSPRTLLNGTVVSNSRRSFTSIGSMSRAAIIRSCLHFPSICRLRFSRLSGFYQANALWAAGHDVLLAIDSTASGGRGHVMLYTEQHRELMRSVTKFVEAEIDPHAEEWEAAGVFPAHELFKKMGAQGFLGINKPEKFGGLGLDYSYEIAFCEALGANRCSGVAMGIGVHTDMATPALTRYGSDELREEFLRPSIAGEYVSCLGVSEAGAGSDVASIKTTARKDGGDYVINGGKMWTTNGTQADWMCLLANTGEGPVHRNKTLICLPMKTKGVEI